MLLCESILMSTIVMLGVYVTYTDIKRGIVQNKILACAVLFGSVINFVYFLVYCREYLFGYLINFWIISLLAVALYLFHFWAAGDSKLLMCVNFLFPARLYNYDETLAPGIKGIVIIFLLAYFYIVIDSIILCVRKEHFYASNKISVDSILGFLKSYLIGFVYLRGFGELLRGLLGDYYYKNQIIFCFINIFVAMIIYNKPIFRRWYLVVLAVVANIVFVNNITFNILNLYSYMILLASLVLRYLLNGYNYKEIDTDTVSQGMVLSYATVLLFSPSRIKGLPHITYEDMRSRITQDEVDAIRKWKDSKYGRDKITIVRKIPFAIFIVLGEVIFFFVRIWR